MNVCGSPVSKPVVFPALSPLPCCKFSWQKRFASLELAKQQRKRHSNAACSLLQAPATSESACKSHLWPISVRTPSQNRITTRDRLEQGAMRKFSFGCPSGHWQMPRQSMTPTPRFGASGVSHICQVLGDRRWAARC